MVVCLSANGGTVYREQTPPTRLLVGTVDGVVTLERPTSDAPWERTRHALRGTHISALLYEPNNGGLFAGVCGRGLFASLDGGETWEPRTHGLASEHIWTLASIEREETVVLYAGTEPAYLCQSNDYGVTWEELPAFSSIPGRDRWHFPPPPHIAHARAIAFDPDDSRTMYVGVEQGALLKSTDAGQSWRELEDYVRPEDVFYKDIHRVIVSPTAPQRIYMVGGDGIYVSTDAGETWVQRTSVRSVGIGYPETLLVSPFDDRVLFVAGAPGDPSQWRQADRPHFGLVRSRDGGETWESLAPRLPHPLQASIEGMSLQVRPGDFSLFAATAMGEVLASDDQGEHWSLIAQGLAPMSQGTRFEIFLPPDSGAQAQEPVGAR